MMLKQGEESKRKENRQHRSKGVVIQGRFGSQQISTALWSTCTRRIWSSCDWRAVEGTLSQIVFVVDSFPHV